MAKGNIYPLHTQHAIQHNLFDLQHTEDVNHRKFTALRRSLKTSQETLSGRMARQGRTQVAWSVIASPLMTSRTANISAQTTTTQSNVQFVTNIGVGETKQIPQIYNGQEMNFTKLPVPNGCVRQHPRPPSFPQRNTEIPQFSTGNTQNNHADSARKSFLESLMDQRSQQFVDKRQQPYVGLNLQSPMPPPPTSSHPATLRSTKTTQQPQPALYYNENSDDFKQKRKVLYRVSFAKSASTLRNRNPTPRNNSPYEVAINQNEWPPSLLRLKLREENKRRSQSAKTIESPLTIEPTSSTSTNTACKVDNPSFFVSTPQLAELSVHEVRKKNVPVFRVRSTHNQKLIERYETADEIIMRRSIEKVQRWINNLPMHFQTIHHVLPPVKQDY